MILPPGALRHTIFTCLCLCFTASSAVCQTIDNNPIAKQEILDQVNVAMSKLAFVPGVDFTKWPEFLNSERPRIDAAANDDEFQRAVNAALRKFGASHIVLNAPKIADLRLTGSMVGIGISTRVVADGLLVTRTVDDAPAERGGIVPGDIIVQVDGKVPQGTKGIEGKDGTDVTLTVRHVDKTTEDYTLTRRVFSSIRPEELKWVDKDTALLTINTFGFSYDKDRVKGFMQEAQQGKHLILDLRDNGGGEIGNLRHLLGFLLPPSVPVGTFIDRTICDDYVSATHGNPTDLAAIAKWTPKKVRPIPQLDVPVFTGQIIILTNGLSGSASEIIAAGLRDLLGSKIVGTKSAGMVLVSRYDAVTNRFMLQYPVSDYVTIKGVRLEGTGVTPDVIVEDTLHLPNAPDPPVEKARAIFAGKV